MEKIFEFLNNPFVGAAIALILSAAMRSVPKPTTNSSFWHLWLFQIAQILAANQDLANSAKNRRAFKTSFNDYKSRVK